MHKRNLESDCVALLAYLWKHRDEEQTYTGLAESTGIPYETIRQMIQWFRKDPNNWALRNYGAKYGYVVRYIGRKPYPRWWHVKRVYTQGVGPVSGGYVSVTIVLNDRAFRIGRFSEEEAREVVMAEEARLSALERKVVDVVYVGTTQDPDGKLLIEDVQEYHPTRESEELTPNHGLEMMG